MVTIPAFRRRSKPDGRPRVSACREASSRFSPGDDIPSHDDQRRRHRNPPHLPHEHERQGVFARAAVSAPGRTVGRCGRRRRVFLQDGRRPSAGGAQAFPRVRARSLRSLSRVLPLLRNSLRSDQCRWVVALCERLVRRRLQSRGDRAHQGPVRVRSRAPSRVQAGGVAIVSTPNVLNLNSRVRYLHSGFTVLFDPLPLSSDDPRHTNGHINPVPYYYLAYQLRRAGFRNVTVHYDRFKTSARALLALWGPFIGIAHALFRGKLTTKKGDISAENADLLREQGSVSMLTSRSVIAVAT